MVTGLLTQHTRVTLNIYTHIAMFGATVLLSGTLQIFIPSILNFINKGHQMYLFAHMVGHLKSFRYFLPLRTFLGFVKLSLKYIGLATDYFINGQRWTFDFDSSTVHDYIQYLASLFERNYVWVSLWKTVCNDLQAYHLQCWLLISECNWSYFFHRLCSYRCSSASFQRTCPQLSISLLEISRSFTTQTII